MPSTLAWVLLLVTLGLWVLGAHNRLVRLRHDLRQAYAPLSSALRQRHAVALTLAETSRPRMAGTAQAELVDATTGAARRAGHACDQVQLKALRGNVLQQVAVAEEASLPELPGVPTFRDGGFDLVFQGWRGLFAPRGTPAAFVSSIERAVFDAFEDNGFVEQIRKLGLSPAPLGAEAFASFWAADRDVVGKLVSRLPRG